jgi:hypothetical protein
VLAISGPGVLPWAQETMVALDEARRVASYGMKLLDFWTRNMPRNDHL